VQARLDGAALVGADLRGANMTMAWCRGAVLEQAGISYAYLGGAHGISEQQLASAKCLAGATLPDDTKLSEHNWQAEFQAWRKKHEEPQPDD